MEESNFRLHKKAVNVERLKGSVAQLDRATVFVKEPLVWKVEKIVSKGDYNYALVKAHPRSNKHGYVLHHRVVMENHLGRLLNSDEIVHHINDCKKDNRIENLQVMSLATHSKIHGFKKGKKMVEMKCPQCKSIFVMPRNKTFYGKKQGKYNTCSSSCRGKFSRNIQIHGETAKVKLAISENIVREYVIYSLDNPEQTANNGMRRDYTPTT